MRKSGIEGDFEWDLSPYEQNCLALLDLHTRQERVLLSHKILQRAHAAATSIRFDHRGEVVVPIIDEHAPWRGFVYQVMESLPASLKAVGCGVRIATPTTGPENNTIEVYSDIPVWMIGHRACLPFIDDDGKVVAELLREIRPQAQELSLTPDLGAVQTQPIS